MDSPTEKHAETIADAVATATVQYLELVNRCRRLERDRAELIEALRDAVKQSDTVWQEASGLRNSKAAGEFSRQARALLSRLGADK